MSLIVIVGPTGVGKTKVSIELASRLNLEVISGDSVAVYKGLDIGSAKPTVEEMNGIKHHLIDILEPTIQYNVSDFKSQARKIIDEKKKIIICGGTGLYIQSVLYDYNFDSPKRDDNYLAKYQDYSNDELYEHLINLDKSINQTKIHKNNRNRVIRAIEVYEKTNRSVHVSNDEQKYDAFIAYLNISDRDKLYDLLDNRVDKMINQGLVDEVYGLYTKGIYPNAIGYKEFIPYFENIISLDAAINEIKKNTRHLAKRQMTWFRNKLNTNFFEVDVDNIYKTIDEIELKIKEYWGL